jgi:tetratricopeptide (TPR) repeat protein
MTSRLLSLTAFLLLAVVLGGADGCASDPNVEGAKLYLRQGEFDQALERLDVALEANPANVDALLLRIDVLNAKADRSTDAAEHGRLAGDMAETLTRARAAAPDAPAVVNTGVRVWAFAVNKGNVALRNAEADPALAINLFETAAAVLPDSSQGHFGLGLAHLRAGDASAAIAPLRTSTEKAPELVSGFIYLGRALMLADRGTEAVTALEDASRRFPDDEDIQSSLLNAYAVSGQTDRALERYAQAAENNPNDPTIRYNFGALLLGAGRYDEAIPQLERAVELSPENPDAHYNLGAAFQNKAAALTQEANATDDNALANSLIQERDEFLNRSVGPLEQARELSDAENRRGVCNALFQVYTQLNRVEDARGVAECAGISMD